MPDDVVTSAQSAAHLLADRLPAGAAVLIVGTESLAAEIENVGLKPVRQWSDDPVAVVQGHSPETGWSDLAEAALAIRARRAVGGRQHRPDAALGTGAAARKRLDGRGAAGRNRPRADRSQASRSRRC